MKNSISVQITQTCKAGPFDPRQLKRLIRCVCLRFNLKTAAISVILLDTTAITDLNRKFLGRNDDTDVISFDLSEPNDRKKTFELVVNAQRAERQACARGHSFQAELALYVLHGLLHNLGFNDAKPRDAEKMHAAEDNILQEFGYGVIYNKQISNTEK
ncbi:MAG: rRNA maturation RNase YbeY [Planctomycetota bacterium]